MHALGMGTSQSMVDHGRLGSLSSTAICLGGQIGASVEASHGTLHSRRLVDGLFTTRIFLFSACVQCPMQKGLFPIWSGIFIYKEWGFVALQYEVNSKYKVLVLNMQSSLVSAFITININKNSNFLSIGPGEPKTLQLNMAHKSSRQ